MNEIISVNHKIQNSIIDLLTYQETARFKDLRPPKTDTNVFSYHLNVLLKSGLLQKVDEGYSLTPLGASYVDRINEKKSLRSQPKIIIMFLVQNSNGDVLLQKRLKQPYINTWTLPYGNVDIQDESLHIAAKRLANKKLGLNNQEFSHAGECYIRVRDSKQVLSTTLVHLFRFNRDDIKTNNDLIWARPHKLAQYQLAPAVEAIIARGFFHDPFFFEEFEDDWYN